MAEEQAMVDAGHHDGGVEEIEGVPPQIQATPGMPERQAVGRRQARVREIMHTLPPNAQEAIRDDLEGTHQYSGHEFGDQETARHRQGTRRPLAASRSAKSADLKVAVSRWVALTGVRRCRSRLSDSRSGRPAFGLANPSPASSTPWPAS